MSTAHDEEIARVFINLNGDFELGDGRIGTVASTPELSELNSFLGVLKDAVDSEGAFSKGFRKIAKEFRETPGAVLEIRTNKVQDSLLHTFRLVAPGHIPYNELDAFLAKHGWSLDCQSPLEISLISDPTSTASGDAAELVIKSLQQS